MKTNEVKIPIYVFEDLLFERRLQRNLNAEQEKLNALLAEHVRLLEVRRQLMSKVHEAVQQRWDTEEAAASSIHSVAMTEEDADAD
jgi:predicted nuclease with TOPRIM domain